MSHVTTIKMEMKDLQALREACEKIGLVFNEGQKTYKWWGYSVGDYPIPKGFTKEDLGKCDHALSVKGDKKAYEIGVVHKDGKYVLLWDFYAGGYGLEKVVGKDCCNLTEAYTQAVALKEASKFAQAQGWSMTHEYDKATSETVIKLRRY
jgi:hypothetical protein